MDLLIGIQKIDLYPKSKNCNFGETILYSHWVANSCFKNKTNFNYVTEIGTTKTAIKSSNLASQPAVARVLSLVCESGLT